MYVTRRNTSYDDTERCRGAVEQVCARLARRLDLNSEMASNSNRSVCTNIPCDWLPNNRHRKNGWRCVLISTYGPASNDSMKFCVL